MPSLSAGQTASIVLAPSDSYTVSTTGSATVRGIYGAPSTTTTLTSNFAVFGPYGVPAKLDVVSVSGAASYGLDQYDGVPVYWKTNDLTGVIELSASGSEILIPRFPQKDALYCFPLEVETSTNAPIDISDTGVIPTIGAANTTPWAVAGRFTAVALDGTLTIPTGVMDYSPEKDSFLLAFVIKAAVPGSTTTFVGQAATGGGTAYGLYINSNASAKADIRVNFNGTVQYLPSSTAAIATASDVHITLFYDSPSRQLFTFINGKFDNQQTVNAATPGTVVTLPFSFGGLQGSGIAGMSHYGLQFYKFSGKAAPISKRCIAYSLFKNPRLPVSANFT